MPRNGLVAAASLTTSTNPSDVRLSIALFAAPTPGKTTRSALRITAGSLVTTASTPSAAKASFTLVRLPAL